MVRRQQWLAFGLFCLAWIGSPNRAEAQLGALLSPGRLAKPHADLEGLANCQSCHERGQKVTAEKCLACHRPIADRIAKRSGVHRNVTTDCVTCHAEHAGADGQLRPFDQVRFDHAMVTGFALDGKHAAPAVQCAACHKERSFLTAKTTCSSCHMDIHKGSLGPNCTSCHSTKTTFKDLSGQFDHAKTAFQVDGAHRTVACAACHVNNKFKGLKFAACSDCHRDPHNQSAAPVPSVPPVTRATPVAPVAAVSARQRQAFGPTCTTCHTTGSWRTKKLDHNTQTSFPLNGSHAALDCATCHKQPSMRVRLKSDTCATCHVDPHKGTFQQDCKACHNETNFKQAPFDHAKTMFALTGKHDGLACGACHRNAVAATTVVAGRRGGAPPPGPSARGVAARAPSALDFRGLSTTCVSCHADVHDAELGTTCESCHSSATFKLPSFKHQRFAEFFGGQHAPVTCEKCHMHQAPTRPTRTGVTLLDITFKKATTTCVSCHLDVHLGQESAPCESCHTVQVAKFKLPNFAHSTKTTFPLTGRHETTTCVECHRPETTAFPAGRGTAVRYKGVPKQCVSCHEDVHLGQFKESCETCHQTSVFKIPKYTHRNARKLAGFFVGSHQRAACEACHKASSGQRANVREPVLRFAIDARCVSCHKDVHRGSLGPDCGSCHRP